MLQYIEASQDNSSLWRLKLCLASKGLLHATVTIRKHACAQSKEASSSLFWLNSSTLLDKQYVIEYTLQLKPKIVKRIKIYRCSLNVT